MAILTRRALRELLEEAPVKPDLLNTHFIQRLNGPSNDQSLTTEWELIMLSALSRVGLVEYEPTLDGPSNLDFRFSASSGLRFIGDVTYLSDDEAVRVNPVASLEDAIHSKLAKYGIRGDLVVTVFSAEVNDSNKTALLIPMPHEFKRYVFDSKFNDFVKAIASSPRQEHSHQVDNEKAKLAVTYRPSAGNTALISYPDFRLPRDIQGNALYNLNYARNRSLALI